MPTTVDSPTLSLRAIMRPVPLIAPEDSLGYFLEMARSQPLMTLPVQRRGVLCGLISYEAILPLLAIDGPEARARALEQPVAAAMRPIPAVARPEMTPEEIGALCARHGLGLIPIADSEDYCLGVVLAGDLLAPPSTAPRPARVGGMATPFGVYLTDGTLQAGASNGALVATGIMMGFLLVLSRLLLGGGLWLAQRFLHLPNSPLLDLDYEPSAREPLLGLASIGLQLTMLALFLLLMRATRLAGYHAAEHQAVHALERNEPLVPGVVARMPRPHPRCGTNIMAAGTLFYTFCRAYTYVPFLDPYTSAPVFAALTTVFTWRAVGTFLQERFTTKPANARELASGIAAANALLDAYLHSPPDRPRFLKRVWCMGLLQTMAGTLIALGAVWLLTSLWGGRTH